MDKQIIVIATKNIGKVKEIQRVLAEYPVQVMSLADFGPTPTPEEDADSFEDNAYKKASFYSRIIGFPTLADDSGLEIEALDGAPGVHSARWAGENATDEQKYLMILDKLKGVSSRKAAFSCALVLAIPTGPGLTWVGKCEGLITEAPKGDHGFGYDPIFYYEQAGKTFAEMTADEKNEVSHRGKALKAFCGELDKALIWLKQRAKEVESPHPH